MGTGVADGEDRAIDAANAAISSPLLEDASVKGARGVIINVTGGPDLSLVEVSEASIVIQEAAHEDANIIFGAVVDPKMEGKVKITVIATGFDRPSAAKSLAPRPRRRRSISSTRPGDGIGREGRRGRRRSTRHLARPTLDLPLTLPQSSDGSAPGADSSRSRRSTCRRSCGGAGTESRAAVSVRRQGVLRFYWGSRTTASRLRRSVIELAGPCRSRRSARPAGTDPAYRTVARPDDGGRRPRV